MRPRRCQLPRGTGPSLTRRDLVDRVGPEGRVDLDPVDPDLVVLDPVGPAALDLAVLDPVGPADPVDLGLEGLAVLHQVDLAVPVHTRDPVGLDPAVLDPVGPAARVGLDPVGPADPVDLAVPAGIRGRVDPVGPVGLDLAGRADQGMNLVDQAVPVGLDLTGRAGLVDLGMNRVVLVDPADRVVLVDPPDRVDPVTRAGRHLRRTHPEVLSTAVAPRWAARGMCRTASAHPVMVRRLRRHSADGVGMAGLHPERRRHGGMHRRPRAAGTAHRLQVVGTPHGMVRRAI